MMLEEGQLMCRSSELEITCIMNFLNLFAALLPSNKFNCRVNCMFIRTTHAQDMNSALVNCNDVHLAPHLKL